MNRDDVLRVEILLSSTRPCSVHHSTSQQLAIGTVCSHGLPRSVSVSSSEAAGLSRSHLQSDNGYNAEELENVIKPGALLSCNDVETKPVVKQFPCWFVF